MNSDAMNRNRNLLIIFGTSRGLGAALHKEAAQCADNDFLLINRKTISGSKKSNEKYVRLDLSKPLRPADLKKLFSFTRSTKQYKNIFLIGNASTIEPIKSVGQITVGEIQTAFNTNVLNYTIIINEFIKKLKKVIGVQKKIVIITSGSAAHPHHNLSLYCATKSAMEMFVRCVYSELQTSNSVKILAIRPGVIDTDMQTRILNSFPVGLPNIDHVRALAKKGLLVTPQERAKQIYSGLFDEKSWTNPVLEIT